MLFDDRTENAVRILRRGHFNPNCCISQGAYVARYLQYIGYDDKSIMDRISKMFYELYGTPSRPDMSNYCKKSILMANRLPPIDTCDIHISNKQLEYIKSIDNISIERFVFVSLCAYKYYCKKEKYSVRVQDVLSFCRLTNDSELYKFLRNNPYIKIQIFHNVDYICIDERLLSLEDDEGMDISDTTNIVYYYEEWRGYGRFIRCMICGCIEKRKSNKSPKKYCPICAAIVHSKQMVASHKRSKSQKMDINQIQ